MSLKIITVPTGPSLSSEHIKQMFHGSYSVLAWLARMTSNFMPDVLNELISFPFLILRCSNLVFPFDTIPRDTCSQGFHTHTLRSTPPSLSRFSNIRDITFTVHQSLSYMDSQPSLKSSDFKTWYHFKLWSIFSSLLTLSTSLKMSN